MLVAGVLVGTGVLTGGFSAAGVVVFGPDPSVLCLLAVGSGPGTLASWVRPPLPDLGPSFVEPLRSGSPTREPSPRRSLPLLFGSTFSLPLPLVPP